MYVFVYLIVFVYPYMVVNGDEWWLIVINALY